VRVSHGVAEIDRNDFRLAEDLIAAQNGPVLGCTRFIVYQARRRLTTSASGAA
jgi:hypothetical protein